MYVRLIEAAVTLAVTLGTTATGLTAFDPQDRLSGVREIADRAGCRTVEAAVAAHLAAHDALPGSITDLAPYVRGDVSGYRLVRGVVTGPGCPAAD